MTARRSAATLCLLICIFAALTITVKQYALIWWTGCIIAAFIGTLLVMNTLQVQEALPRRLLRASVFVVPAAAIAIGLLVRYVTSR